MSAPLTYLPAYIGLFASLMLAVACNAFLDIQYGSFGFEMFFWGLLFGWTLLVRWKQHGQANDSGPQQQKVVLLLGLVATVIVFIPMWGFPRAGLYMLVVLQGALNCVTTTRRHLHFGLLVSLVMVMSAAAHYRADWTLLFYLIPYIIAVVFTMAEQISRRAQGHSSAARNASAAGQGLAIVGGNLHHSQPRRGTVSGNATTDMARTGVALRAADYPSVSRQNRGKRKSRPIRQRQPGQWAR